MKRHAALAVVLASGLAAGARGETPVDRAKDVQRVTDQGNARVQKAADAQLEQADEKSAPAGKPAKAPPAEDLGAGPPEGGARAADEGRGQVPPPDTYTIRPGDTLWDLSGRFLNNPWYWPKVWSYNPEITNPHWIYPGNVLRFYPSEEEAPVRVEPVEAGAGQAAGEPGAEEEEYEPPRELEDLSKADMKVPPPEEEKDAVAVAGPYKIGYVASNATLTRHDGLVTPRELAESGTIVNAFEEKLLLSMLDRTYAQFKGTPPVKVGESYVVYKTLRPVKHPVTGELFGYQSTILGSAKVVAVGDKAATLVITRSFAPIERGNLLAPWPERTFRRVERKPNTLSLDGRILTTQIEVLTQLAQFNVVFVDKGSADGVQEGNVFKVLRSGDPYGRKPSEASWDPKLPPETIGELLIVDVKERASSAFVTRSLRELVVGDRIEMRPSGGAGGN